MMGPLWKRRFRRVAWGCFAFWLFIVLFAHPFFAVVAPSGGEVLVVEGWMHDEGLKEAADLFNEGGYDHLYITGTPRPFAYYLHDGDTVVLRFAKPTNGKLLLGAAGLPGASWSLTIDGTASTSRSVTGDIQDNTIELHDARDIRIVAASKTPPPSGEPVLFLGRLWVDGRNAHLLGATITIHRTNGNKEPGRPTFAHEAYFILQGKGVPADRMTVVPTWVVDKSRTLSTARDLIALANTQGIKSFDIATVAVHARRTRNMYRKAKGTPDGVGIIALHDPWCQRWTWWMNYYGWFQVGKELVAWPAPWLFDNPDPEAE
ncbi:MAG: hypothetical protein KA941_12845 [Flavobacteriales bacterium]|nr:hypothetical protein [Flavobacteriales bacterium]